MIFVGMVYREIDKRDQRRVKLVAGYSWLRSQTVKQDSYA